MRYRSRYAYPFRYIMRIQKRDFGCEEVCNHAHAYTVACPSSPQQRNDGTYAQATVQICKCMSTNPVEDTAKHKDKIHNCYHGLVHMLVCLHVCVCMSVWMDGWRAYDCARDCIAAHKHAHLKSFHNAHSNHACMLLCDALSIMCLCSMHACVCLYACVDAHMHMRAHTYAYVCGYVCARVHLILT